MRREKNIMTMVSCPLQRLHIVFYCERTAKHDPKCINNMNDGRKCSGVSLHTKFRSDNIEFLQNSSDSLFFLGCSMKNRINSIIILCILYGHSSACMESFEIFCKRNIFGKKRETICVHCVLQQCICSERIVQKGIEKDKP